MDEEISLKLKILHDAYDANLPLKLSELQVAWLEFCKTNQLEDLKTFHRYIHSICGSSGTYGYSKLSEKSRTIEIKVKAFLNYPNSLEETDKNTIESLITALPNYTESLTKINNLDLVAHKNKKKRIILLDDDTKLMNDLSYHQLMSDYTFEFTDEALHHKSMTPAHIPSAIIFKSTFLERPEAQMVFNLQKKYDIPTICLSEMTDFMTRLKALRHGATHYITLPVNANFLIQLLDRIISTTEMKYRVLILDDTELLAKYYEIVLKEVGIEALAITEPQNLFNIINEFQPNLLLLDLYMPLCNGIEIAKIIRQEERYANLPIIFLSIEYDEFKKQASISSGADDFLTKPIKPQLLISTIVSRIRRANHLATFIQKDSLTHLLNHSYILEQLDLEKMRCNQKLQPLAFAMIDIDFFKKINDKYGHLAGDYVLSKISEFMMLNLRKTDYAGRYGGEEFAVVMPNTRLTDACNSLNRLRLEFSKIPFYFKGDKFYITFSVGIACFPQFVETTELIAAADKALYAAKANGRNRVEISQTERNNTE